MKSLLVGISLVLLSTTAFAQQQTANPLGDGRLNYPQGFPTSQVGVPAYPSLKDLSKKETKIWQARANAKLDPIRHLVSDDATIASTTGVTNRMELIAQVKSGVCKITSYRLENFVLKLSSPTAVTISYRAEQDAACNGKPLPAALNVTATYLNHEGRWLNSSYEEKPATTPAPDLKPGDR
jgi:hypothetical protein